MASAPSLQAIMEGLEAALATIPALRTSAVTPDQVTPPVAIVGVPPWTIETMKTGFIKLPFSVTILTSTTLDRIGQMELAAFASPTGDKSIRAAIEADKTLGGVANDAAVLSFRPLGLDEVGVIQYYGGVFEVIVAAQGRDT